jgi:hypothetical protein
VDGWFCTPLIIEGDAITDMVSAIEDVLHSPVGYPKHLEFPSVVNLVEGSVSESMCMLNGLRTDRHTFLLISCGGIIPG